MSFSRHTYAIGDEPVPDYRLTEFLGAGTFGEVWKAIAPGGGDNALKIISLAAGEGYVEFAALQRVKLIHHPNLTPVNASWLRGEDGRILDEETAGQVAQYSMTSAKGDTRATAPLPDAVGFPRLKELIIAMGLGSNSLLAKLEEYGRRGVGDSSNAGIPTEELLGYIEGAAKGVDYLNQPIHNLGPDERSVSIIHGDIKPANMLIVGDEVQVCDFGLATAVETVRETRHVRGSVAYAAPEALDRKRHVASDQYSLALSYVELRTGSLPFHAQASPAQIVAAHLSGRLDLSGLEPAEQEVIRKATALNPDRRWKTCREMVRRLRQALDSPEAMADESEPPEIPPTGTAMAPLDFTVSFGQPPSQPPAEAAVTQDLSTAETDRVEPKGEPKVAVPKGEPKVAVPKGESKVVEKPRPSWVRRAILPLLALAAGIGVVAMSLNWQSELDVWIAGWKRSVDQQKTPLAAAMQRLDNEAPDDLSVKQKKELERHARAAWLRHADEKVAAGLFSEAIGLADEVLAPACFPEDEDAVAARNRALSYQQFEVSWVESVHSKTLDRTRIDEELEKAPSGFPQEKKEELRGYADKLLVETPPPPPPPPQVWAELINEILADKTTLAKALQWLDSIEITPEKKEPLLQDGRTQLLAKAVELHTAEDFSRAVDLCTQLLETTHYQNDGRARLICARANVRLDQHEAALVDLDSPDVSTEAPYLHAALALIAERSRKDTPPDPDAVLSRLLKLRGEQAPAEESPWSLDTRERELLGPIPDWLSQEYLALVAGRLDRPTFTKPQWDEARKALQSVEQTSTDDSHMAEFQIWRAIVEFGDPKAETQAATQALAAAAEALAELAPAQSFLKLDLCTALVRTAEDASTADSAKLDGAITVVRTACELDQRKLEARFPEQLRRLWAMRIAIRVGEPKLPTPEELAALQQDWQRKPTPQYEDDLTATWRAECLTLSGQPQQAVAIVPSQGDPYVHYVRAMVASSLPNPDWSDVVDELNRVLAGSGKLPAVFSAQDRLPKALALAVRAAQQLREQVGPPASAKRLDRFVGNPFTDPDEAKLLYTLLRRTHDLALGVLSAEEQQRLRLGLGLTIWWYRSLADEELANSLSTELDELFTADDLEQWIDAELAADRLRVVDMVLSISLERLKANPDAPALRRVAIRAGSRLIELCGPELTGTDSEAVAFYIERVQPVADLAEEVARAASESPAKAAALLGPADFATAASHLEDFYAAAGNFIAAHRRARQWASDLPEGAPDQHARRARMFGWAIFFHRGRPENQQDDDQLADYHLQRGGAMLEQKPSDVDGALADADSALESTHWRRAHGLKSHAQLIRARRQDRFEDRVADLAESIAAGERAVDAGEIGHAPDSDEFLPTYLLNLSSAYVEKANFEKDPTGEKQTEYLNLAVQYAQRAEQLESRYPDYVHLALGNAYEDLAWLAEKDSPENYCRSIHAFSTALKLYPLSAQALCNRGRCQYRYAADTRLDAKHLRESELLQSLDPKYAAMQDLDAVVDASKSDFQEALKLDPGMIEAYYFSAMAHQFQSRPAEADALYLQAKDRAVATEHPHRASYIAMWAAFPLSDPRLTPQQRSESARDRAKLLLQNVPKPPGSLTDPKKEETRIRAEALALIGGPDEALRVLDEMIPADLSQADASDAGMLLARARHRLMRPDEQWDRTAAEAVIEDAGRVAELSTGRGYTASARWTAAQASFRLHDKLPSSDPGRKAVLDRGIADVEEALRLSPRGAAGADWRLTGAIRLLQKRRDGPAAEADQLKARVQQWIDTAITMTEADIALADGRRNQPREQSELDALDRQLGLLKSRLGQLNRIRSAP